MTCEYEDGCCDTCDGKGTSYDEQTGGKCWDCYGTGHVHEIEVTFKQSGVITAEQINRAIGRSIQQSRRFQG
ncbi:hypothetical protein SEA_COMRADE_69 [Streptomyces phage Comrade]|uniref:Uncharacterized protein n=1 Tax=Streptomyces phage Comrade TaxID=2301714 RepID=A0A385DXT3_9CAUD|nr:hypothetical protein HWB84_gp177 [Streptomyces phage Comrade]AXQ63339.1 hypothetical protein SEA_COMRADE_69 [Streptomyces phage Comrade]